MNDLRPRVFPHRRVRFAGARGQPLAGVLELPFGRPRAFALFAHCFTCSKDLHAAVRISRALAAAGYAVLRFDFTGIGESADGERDARVPAGFSADVDDLVAAAAFLGREFEPPALVIGHSLGGAAALAAAAAIDGLRAVVTIAAPSDPSHLIETLGVDPDAVEAEGAQRVAVGGRPFCITRAFVEELRATPLLERVRALRVPLLLFHAPRDSVVPIDHAAALFQAAHHPKSFVSLDDADHLLSRPEDARFVAEVTAAWAARYLPATGDRTSVAPLGDGEVLVRETGARYTQEVLTSRHRLLADEPLSLGGSDAGPSPYELLLAALGACTAITLRMYAERKSLPLEEVSVRLAHRKVHAEDCAECETRQGKVDLIDRHIVLRGPLDDAARERLADIADRCPVHRTLHSEVHVRTRIEDDDDGH